MQDIESTITALEARLRGTSRGSERRTGVRLQLGMALLQAGRYARAEEELAAAAEGLDPTTSPREHATALLNLGIVCRDTGRAGVAGELFAHAAEGFDRAGAPLERGAALHDLGLTHLDRDDPAAAVAAFREAREVLAPDRVPAQAAANLRELGGALLTLGELDEAATLLEAAAELSGRAGDLAGEGSAANGLGLVALAREDAAAAIAAFSRAVAAHPRTIRPDAHAMARANLAIAHEAAGDPPRARLAAGQALAVPGAPEVVRAQARAVRDRLGVDPDDLHAVLDAVAPDDWEDPVHAEVDRWSLLDESELTAAVDGWLAGVLRRDGQRVERTAVLVGRLLELPPAAMERLVGRVVARAAERPEDELERLRSAFSRALARFPIPQWMRLKDTVVHLTGDARWG